MEAIQIQPSHQALFSGGHGFQYIAAPMGCKTTSDASCHTVDCEAYRQHVLWRTWPRSRGCLKPLNPKLCTLNLGARGAGASSR